MRSSQERIVKLQFQPFVIIIYYPKTVKQKCSQQQTRALHTWSQWWKWKRFVRLRCNRPFLFDHPIRSASEVLGTHKIWTRFQKQLLVRIYRQVFINWNRQSQTRSVFLPDARTIYRFRCPEKWSLPRKISNNSRQICADHRRRSLRIRDPAPSPRR